MMGESLCVCVCVDILVFVCVCAYLFMSIPVYFFMFPCSGLSAVLPLMVYQYVRQPQHLPHRLPTPQDE